MRVAIDTGGTFTDCVTLVEGKLKVLKLSSTPSDPSLAVLEGLQRLAGDSSVEVRHGTTVGTNTMLQKNGARVAFITTAGFEDTISIGRQARSQLYNWFAPVPRCLVPSELRFGVPERVSAEGEILLRPSDSELAALVEKVRASNAEAVAISLIFGFANPETEVRVEEAMLRLGIPVSTAHRILPEFREYERASTIVVNAYLAPRMEGYLTRLEDQATFEHPGSRVDVMQSSGGILPARVLAREPVRTVLSGPAGGVVGACRVASLAGFERIIGFDMGGTSTDVFLANASVGALQTREALIAGVPIAVPMLDIHTAGAGGGSIARFDAGGMLRVGPESAGADPGPACFGRGLRPTVTDANCLLGRLDPDSFLGGENRLDRERADCILDEHKGQLGNAEQFADGILRVVESEMEKAIRVISIERGHDPREFTLVAFGGGGPLHACSLARSLRIPTVLIPAAPGALSAIGILLADSVRDYSRTVMVPGGSIKFMAAHFEEIEQRGREDFAADGLQGSVHRTVDIRYRGQAYELNVPWDERRPLSAIEAFHELHRSTYGFCDAERAVEIVNVRLRMTAKGETYEPQQGVHRRAGEQAPWFSLRKVFFKGVALDARVYHRKDLQCGDLIAGPGIVTEYSAVTVVSPGDAAKVDRWGNLIISIGQGGES